MKFSLFKPNFLKNNFRVFIAVSLLVGIFLSGSQTAAASLPSVYEATFSPLFSTTLAFAEEEVVLEETVVEPAPIENPTPEQVKAEIIRQANIYGVNVNTALRIARCESGYKFNAKNGTSTAKGVYQFINGTWKWIGAEGHQFDYMENIEQFMKWYPRYPQWWECK